MTHFQKQEELFQQLQQVAAQRKACDSRLPEYMELLEKENALLKEYNSVPSDKDRLAQIETRLKVLMRKNDADTLSLDEGQELSSLFQEKIELINELTLGGAIPLSNSSDFGEKVGKIVLGIFCGVMVGCLILAILMALYVHSL